MRFLPAIDPSLNQVLYRFRRFESSFLSFVFSTVGSPIFLKRLESTMPTAIGNFFIPKNQGRELSVEEAIKKLKKILKHVKHVSNIDLTQKPDED